MTMIGLNASVFNCHREITPYPRIKPVTPVITNPMLLPTEPTRQANTYKLHVYTNHIMCAQNTNISLWIVLVFCLSMY